MSIEKAKLLLVDDDVLIRQLLSIILAESGYTVRSAEDGFSALGQIRNEVPDIILSDLNMSGMSGFELLSVVRRRFPAIRVIAMSAMFSGNGVPPGVVADAFYAKGTNLSLLLQIVEAMTHPRLPFLQHAGTVAPIWIPKNGHDPSGDEYVMITCPECLRTFPEVLGENARLIHETGCVHCSSLIQYAIVQSPDHGAPETFRPQPSAGVPTLITEKPQGYGGRLESAVP